MKDHVLQKLNIFASNWCCNSLLDCTEKGIPLKPGTVPAAVKPGQPYS